MRILSQLGPYPPPKKNKKKILVREEIALLFHMFNFGNISDECLLELIVWNVDNSFLILTDIIKLFLCLFC